jgi:hypothetical protein
MRRKFPPQPGLRSKAGWAMFGDGLGRFRSSNCGEHRNKALGAGRLWRAAFGFSRPLGISCADSVGRRASLPRINESREWHPSKPWRERIGQIAGFESINLLNLVRFIDFTANCMGCPAVSK